MKMINNQPFIEREVEGEKFLIPKNISKLMGGEVVIHEWGKIKSDRDHTKSNKYILEVTQYPLRPYDKNPLSQEDIDGKNLQPGDTVGFIGFTLNGKRTIDFFKEYVQK